MLLHRKDDLKLYLGYFQPGALFLKKRFVRKGDFLKVGRL